MRALKEIMAELDAELPLLEQVERDIKALEFEQAVTGSNLTDGERQLLWLLYVGNEPEEEKLLKLQSLPEALQDAALNLLGYEIDEEG